MYSEQQPVIKTTFWHRWSTFAPDNQGYNLLLRECPPSGESEVNNSLAVDACWFSILNDSFNEWEQWAKMKDVEGHFPGENPILRRKLVDADMILKIATSVHNEARDTRQLGWAQLSRIWMIKSLNFFATELPLYIQLELPAWQNQAMKFIQGTFFTQEGGGR